MCRSDNTWKKTFACFETNGIKIFFIFCCFEIRSNTMPSVEENIEIAIGKSNFREWLILFRRYFFWEKMKSSYHLSNFRKYFLLFF